jgi:hypothetical protein
MQDKRKFRRCQIKEKAWIQSQGGENKEGTVFDIGMGGVRVLLDKKVEVGVKLTGRFKIVPHIGYFFVQGEVAWSKPVADDTGDLTGYAVGIKFNKVSTISFE